MTKLFLRTLKQPFGINSQIVVNIFREIPNKYSILAIEESDIKYIISLRFNKWCLIQVIYIFETQILQDVLYLIPDIYVLH